MTPKSESPPLNGATLNDPLKLQALKCLPALSIKTVLSEVKLHK